MHLFLTKVLLPEDTNSGSLGANLFARIFEKIFAILCTRFIGM
jgi:hypothetical protein